MKHIIDTVSKLKKECDVMCGDSPHDVRTYNEAIDDALDAIRALISNSPQADGIDLIDYEALKERAHIDHVRQLEYWKILVKHGLSAEAEKAVSAYKPQADDVPPDVYDIVVDTGDGIYHTAEVVHFQQSGSKRMIQVRLGEPQPDDVRKDAERWRFVTGENGYCVCKYYDSPYGEGYVPVDVEAIDKARE